mmetsp:Transcript_49938/g.85850  ORF Transcript_49938/g.85850 Transcript_49938/m.85850 type:complete len:84 (-) Transcript_49938:60-311(-)
MFTPLASGSTIRIQGGLSAPFTSLGLGFALRQSRCNFQELLLVVLGRRDCGCLRIAQSRFSNRQHSRCSWHPHPSFGRWTQRG